MATEKDLKTEELVLKVMKEQNVTRERALELIQESVRAIQKAKEAADGFTDTLANGIREADDAIDDLGDSLKGLAWDEGLPVNQATEFTKEISDLQKELQGIKNQKGPMDKKALEVQQKRIAQIQKNINRTRVGIIGATKGSKKLSSSFLLMGEGSQGFGSMWKAVGSKSPKQLKESAESAGRIGTQMKNWGSLLAASGKGFSGLGNLVGLLGKGLGGLSKLMGGPVGIGMIAVKAIWDIGMAADKFVKDANKAFAMVRGPDIMTKDIKKQFKDFNNAVYNIGENIRTGLNAAQVREFFQAVTQAGTTLGKLTTGYGDYRDAVYMAARASKVMGVELPQVGAMISDLMNNFRMRMKDIDTLFTQTAFSAGKAGISTDKFWNAITNANASLAFYNVSLSSTAKQLEKFTDSGVLGFEDASKLATDFAQSFKNMSSNQRAAFTELVGIDKMRDALKEAGERANKEYTEINKKIESKKFLLEMASPEDKENIAAEISKMQKQANAALTKKQSMEQGANQKNAVAMGEYIMYAGEDAGELIANMLKNTVLREGQTMKDVTGEALRTNQAVLEAMGINTDVLMKMKELSQQTYNQQTSMLGISKSGKQAGTNVMNSLDKFVGYSKELTGLQSENIEIQAAAKRAIVDGFVKSGKMTETEAVDLVNAISLSKDVTAAVQKAVIDNTKNNDPKKIAQELAAAYEKSKVWDKVLSTETDAVSVQEGMKKKAEETFKNIVNQTLSFEEMQAITKDGLQWQVYQLGFLQSLNQGVFSIYKLMLGKQKSPEQKEADKARVKAGFATARHSVAGIGWGGDVDQEKVNAAIKVSSRAAAETQKSVDSLQETLKKQTDELTTLGEKGDKDAIKRQRDRIELTKRSLKTAQDSLIETGKQLKLLTTGNETSEKMAKLLKMMFAGDKKALGVEIAAMMEEGKTLPMIFEELGISMSDSVEALMVAGLWEEKKGKSGLMREDAGAIAKGRKKYEAYQAANKKTEEASGTPATPGTPEKTQAGLIGSYQVKRQSENLLLHRGETVTGAQQGGGKSISITVNATETDLAKKIANEIQAALYQAKMV